MAFGDDVSYEKSEECIKTDIIKKMWEKASGSAPQPTLDKIFNVDIEFLPYYKREKVKLEAKEHVAYKE
ncbi:hypothetical protein SAY87_006354 [Trapa incisa]|uniref:Uncharacterized protein n=1 Tax=Trapa incisa TaxID=236973 RepID=A0AAN7PY50_9MYRT|nr:hypothetical protein SAY87_006354 [Trapa incisa]